MGLEGIVSKRLGSRYRSGRSPDWLKMKNPACAAVKREAECTDRYFYGCPGLSSLSYAISPFCPTSADGQHKHDPSASVSQWKGKSRY